MPAAQATIRTLPMLVLWAATLTACAEADKPDSGAADSGTASISGDSGATGDTGPEEGEPSDDCRDAIDNDGDGWVDGDDPDCPAGETGGYGSAVCNDGVDNDADGLTDADDRDCDSATDGSES